MSELNLTEPITITLSLDTTVGRVYNGEDEDAPLSLGEALLDRLERRLVASFQAQANQMLSTALAQQVKAKAVELVEEAVNAPIRKTNSWGEATGVETSLRQMLHDEVQSLLTKQSQGYGSRDSKTFIQTLVGSQASVMLEKEFQVALNEGKEQVLAAVKNRAAEVISESLRRAVKI